MDTVSAVAFLHTTVAEEEPGADSETESITDPLDIGPALRAAVANQGPSLLDVSVADGFGG